MRLNFAQRGLIQAPSYILNFKDIRIAITKLLAVHLQL